MTFPLGRYVTIDAKRGNCAVGLCDYSGLPFNRRDMVKQMEWRGNRLVWNGFIVGPPFADVPNEQLRPPLFNGPDPAPVKQPRPPQGDIITWSSIQGPVWSELQIVSWTSWGTYITLEQVDLIGSLDNFEFGPVYEDGVTCLPEDERLAALRRVSWGAL